MVAGGELQHYQVKVGYLGFMNQYFICVQLTSMRVRCGIEQYSEEHSGVRVMCSLGCLLVNLPVKHARTLRKQRRRTQNGSTRTQMSVYFTKLKNKNEMSRIWWSIVPFSQRTRQERTQNSSTSECLSHLVLHSGCARTLRGTTNQLCWFVVPRSVRAHPEQNTYAYKRYVRNDMCSVGP